MKSRFKRNAVVVTMALLVCAAAALNWKYTGQQATGTAQTGQTTQQTEQQGDGTKILGEAELVSGVEDDGAQEASAGAGDEEAVYTGSDYFASARLTRQQARDSAVSLLQEAAEQEGAGEAAATEASEGIAALAGYTMKEAQIENLVTAKGYADCVAFMGDEGVSVVVATETGELTAEDVAKITDITVNETGYAASSVRIMAAN